MWTDAKTTAVVGAAASARGVVALPAGPARRKCAAAVRAKAGVSSEPPLATARDDEQERRLRVLLLARRNTLPVLSGSAPFMGMRHSLRWPSGWPALVRSRERISEPCAVHRAWFLSDRSVQLPSTRTLFVRNRESDGARDIGATRARRAPGGCRRRRSTRPTGSVRRMPRRRSVA